MNDVVFAPVDPHLRSFLDANPGIGIRDTDFYREELLARMRFEGTDRDQVLTAARAHASLVRLTDDPDIVNHLYRSGLHSAAEIANRPLYAVREQLARVSGTDAVSDEALAEVHAAAVDVHSRAVHLATQMRGALSPHGRVSSANNVVKLLAEEFGHLPSFSDLFGSQDYIPSPHCQSVIGPAAYFVDLMRVTDEDISGNPKNKIPDWAKLITRRKGLFTQPLTCAETNTPVPKLQIVNQVIHDFLAQQIGDDTDYAIATRVFPYNLPINVRLRQMRAAMAQLGAPLVGLYQTYVGRADDLDTMPDAAAIAAEHLSLSPEQRKLVEVPRSGQGLADCFGGGETLLTQPIKTTVSISKDSLTVTGSGFQAAAAKASILRVGTTLRAVVTIDSDTELKVDQAWPETSANVEGWFYPPSTLSQASVLSVRTHLDDAAIAALFVDSLDAKELEVGLAAKLYINAVSEDPRAQLISDRTDVSYSLQVVEQLDAARIDRLNRIVRLSQVSGVPVADLDWTLHASGQADFAGIGLTRVGETVALARRLAIPMEEATALWSVLKTWGRGDGPQPADLFDRVFNSAGDPIGTYRPRYDDNPLFTDKVKSWTLGSSGKESQAIRTFLSAALAVSDKDLTRIGETVAAGAGKLELTVPTLSALWSIAKLARTLAISVADCTAMMRLAGLSRFAQPADVARLIELKALIAERSLSLADLAFIVWGEPGDKTDVVRAVDVPPFLAALRAMAGDWLAKPSNFSGDDDSGLGLRIFEALVYGGALDRSGVVTFPSWKLNFTVLTGLFPVSAEQLLVPDIITEEEAVEAYEALIDAAIILGNALAAPVNEGTDLSFLFPEIAEPERKIKIAAIRSVLSDLSQRVLLSVAVLVPALRAQIEGTFAQLGTLLGCPADVAQVTVTDVLAKAFAGLDARVLLLTSAGDITALTAPLLLSDRIAYLAEILTLKATDLTDAVASPKAFGLTSLEDLTMKAVRAWSDYATLVALYQPLTDGPRNIALYLTTANVAALSKATGWDSTAFLDLVTALWGRQITLTPSMLWLVRACFVLAGTMGTDVGSATEIAKASRLAPLSGVTPPPAWATYADDAAALLAMLKAKSAGSDWASTYKPVSDSLETARRDGLAPLAVWINAGEPLNLSTVRALSEYLLIDVETSACDVTSAIVEATAAVQTYLQRCRMSLEPGVVSLGDIAPVWWSWLSNYRVWEANRKIFLYPENYIDPNLRHDRTDLFRKLQEELQQSNITPATVERAFTNYLTAFADLAKLRTVESTRAVAPHPVSGTPVETVFFLGRTEATPYQYYYRTLRKGNIWSQWSKIDVATTSPDASLVFAFNRLILFWVEVDTVKGSVIKDSNQHDKQVRRANIRYAYRRLDETWSAPQTLEAEGLFDAQPTPYHNNVIDPRPGEPSVNGVDPKMPYWRRAFVQRVPAETDGGERLLITFGNAFPVPTTPIVPPPPEKFDTADERQFVSNVYRASQLGASFSGKQPGSILLIPAAYLDIGMNVQSIAAFLPDFTSEPNDQPFAFIKFKKDLGPNLSRSVLVDSAFVDSPDYPDRVIDAPIDMITNVASDASVLAIKNQVGWFVFDNGDEAFLMTPQDVEFKAVEDILEISTEDIQVKTIDKKDVTVPCQVIACGKYSDNPVNPGGLVFDFTRLTTSAVGRLIQIMTFGGIDELLSIRTQEAQGPASLDFARFYPGGTQPENVGPPKTMNGGAVDFNGAYRPYFDEIYFQVPFFIAGQLSANQHHEAAKDWYDYIFDPAALSKGQVPVIGNSESVYWQFLPFRKLTAQSLVDELTDQTAIEAWNADPFDPQTVAQLRPVAYEKTIVQHYIGNLLDWADSLFARDTRESVNHATLLYLMAADLLGPRPRQRGVYQPPAPIDFAKIKADSGKLIPQFLIELERVMPPPQPGYLRLEPAPFNMISAYFTVPESSEFISYWDRLESTLYKVRHCLSLAGLPRVLPLFDPPIDPRALIRAGGGSNSPAVINQGAGSLPHYRFQVMLDRANQLTQTLIGFGAALLAALEKKDAENLHMLQVKQERAILVQTGDLKAQLVLEAEDQLESLLQSKLAAQERLNYYTKMLSDGLSPAEITSLTTMILANVFQTTAGVIRSLSGGVHLVPNAGSPFAMTYGGREIGASLDAFASAADTVSGTLNFASTLSGVIAGFERREQEWTLQKSTAGYEVAQMDAQIAAAQARVASLKRDVTINTLSIEQNNAIQAALTSKFTNADLYSWMAARLQALYFQCYKIALDLSLAAQRAYQYELDSGNSILDFAYWESGRAGLLAGEGLQVALGQLEHAYYTTNRRRLTIEKTVSLWALDPLALLTLQRTGSCNFQLSELLFDYDFPGQYCRKIERLSVTIPAVVGPYQNVHGTLTQTGNTVLIKDDTASVRFLLGADVTPTDGALRLNWRNMQQIALSRGADDGTIAGVSADDRYLPFEGTGAISTWRLDLPLGANRIDFSAIADVVITLTYSAVVGGGVFKDAVVGMIADKYAGQASMALQQRYPDAWARFLNPGAPLPQSMTFAVGPDAVPTNLGSPRAVKAYVQFDLTIPFTGPLKVELAPAAGGSLTLDLTQKTPWAAGAIDCLLTPGANWTLTLKQIPPALLQDGHLKPGVLTGVTLVLDYTATLRKA
jgi:receptor-binding and translocation channel-forming TcA subunit of Tc toxin/ABC toxin-like protein/neuraminidase-like protein